MVGLGWLKLRWQASRFIGGGAPSREAIILDQRRIYILPSRRGLGFVVLIGLLLLIAFVYNNNLAYALAFLLASIFFVTILHTFMTLKDLRIQPGNQTPVFCGEMAAFNFKIVNPANNARHAVQLTLQQTLEVTLPAGQGLTVSLPLMTERRGWLLCPKLTIASAYPLGLFRAWSPLRFDCRLLVYPKPHPQWLPFPEGGGLGEQLHRLRGQGDEFDGVKTYQVGDSIRQIHWRAMAKGLGLQSRQFAGAGGDSLIFDYTTTPGATVEERLSIMCRWLVEAERAGLHYGLRLPAREITVANGTDHYRRCLQALAES